MEFDKKQQLYSCPRDCVKPMSLVMDDPGSQPHPRSSGLRVSTKSKAPSPPGLKKLDSPGFSQWYPGNPHLTMEQMENLIDKDLNLVVVLPGGVEKMTTVHGSKPLMDLLVTLCAKYHLNPSGHTLELVSSNKKNTKLKPNALIGTLDAEKILLKPKGADKNKKTGPQMPEATVRMVINYRKTQKTILRVNPRVPLAEHLPAICEKCEFDVESTVLLRDVQSLAPLDLSSSLNDYAIREVYARDTRIVPASPLFHTSSSHAGTVMPGKDKNQKEQENKGLFSKFRKSKKKSEQATAVSAPASPVLVSKPRPLSMALPSSSSTMLDSPSSPTDAPKKRRAPQPPIVVSQSCSSDLTPRRRLYSEPAQLDGDQMSGLSRGSSAESSLKRTKRKAPLPPTSPSAVVQETVPSDGDLQVAVSATTLEEIMEQEESSVSALSATAGDAQGEDSSLNMSTEASLHSPSPDTERLSVMSAEGNGEDQSHDLSSDGNVLQSTVNSNAALSDVSTTDMDSSELAETNDGHSQVDHVSQPPVSEEPTPEKVEGDYSTLPSSLPLSVMKDAEAQASDQANTETPREHTDTPESPVATSTSRPAGEDAQVQTDFTPPPELPQEHMVVTPSSANAPALETAGKKETATSTDELDTPDLKPALPLTAETSTCQDTTPSAPAAAKVPSTYATNSEPKPKPSNELTRNYIPKVGMTTYTIVPQKSLEKLRYFEVALTLESPAATQEGGLDIGSLHLEERGQTEASETKSELHSTVPREDLLTSTTTTATTQDTVNGSVPESIDPSSPTRSPKADDKILSSADRASQAGSPTEVKQVKIPPATKPKPGSFRLPQHKKTPGYYVTSAAGKSPVTSPVISPVTSPVSPQREAQGTTVGEDFPPPPPPVLFQEETNGASSAQLSPTGVNKNVPLARMTRQSSLPCREPKLALSLEKLRSFAAPRPYSPATPSRFAQAVSSAVKRSNSLSYGTKLPQSPSLSPSLSPIPSNSPGTESKGLSKLMDGENGQAYSNKDPTLQGVEDQASSFSEIVQMEGESSP